jgi:hypothetical protein
MNRTDVRLTSAIDFAQPVDLAFCNGLGILMRERRRMHRRGDLTGRDLIPTAVDSDRMRLSARTLRRADSDKNGAQ